MLYDIYVKTVSIAICFIREVSCKSFDFFGKSGTISTGIYRGSAKNHGTGGRG